MGRRANYGFEKRQREIKKQKKKEAKAERRRLAKEAAQAEAAGESPIVDGEEMLDVDMEAGGDGAAEMNPVEDAEPTDAFDATSEDPPRV